MRAFDYVHLPETLLTPEISSLLSSIHEYRGKQDLYIEAKRDVLDALVEVAMIQSTDASNRIEGIFTSDIRLKQLVEEKVVPHNRNEKEIAGYRDVLATIHENFNFIPLTPNTILQLHRDLYSFLPEGMGGHWKNNDNIIAETMQDGTQHVRFKPVSAFETPETMEHLCSAFQNAVRENRHDPLLLTLVFTFDFLCIHPFNDGNGRMSRLLTLLLLYKNRYLVGKYISLESLIEKSKITYYETLQQSSEHWQEGSNDYKPFIEYGLGIILKAYREFEKRVEHVMISKLSKKQRIQRLFEQNLGKLSKNDILTYCPDISVAMIEKTLKELLSSGFIEKIGSGRSSAYIKH